MLRLTHQQGKPQTYYFWVYCKYLKKIYKCLFNLHFKIFYYLTLMVIKTVLYLYLSFDILTFIDRKNREQ